MPLSLLDPVVLAATAARTATGTGDTVDIPDGTTALLCVLDLTGAATDAADTLDVTIEAYLGSGVASGEQWLTICAFTQILGNGADEITRVEKILGGGALTGFETGSALAAGTVRNILVGKLRAKWTIVDADGDASFTFSVVVVPG